MAAGGSALRFFVLKEDLDGDGPAKADWVRRTDNDSRGVFDVYGYSGIMSGAKAGYKGVVARIDGEWVPPVNPCIKPCLTSGSITGGSETATVGDPYSYTVSSSGLDSGPTATNLPAGLTYASPTISGTPTTAGTYYITLSGSANGCAITKILTLKVEE